MASYFLLRIIRKLPGRVIKLIPKPRTALTEGFGSRNMVGALCSAAGYQSVLLVTDQTLFSLGYHTAVVDSLTEQKIRCTVFHEIASEPNIGIIEKGRAAAIDCGASCIVALGGGSVLDSSKMIAAGTKLKKRRIPSLLKKFLFVRGGTLPMISIPSTAGTGAEFTVGAVVTGSKGKKGSTVLIGLKVTDVILDSELTNKHPLHRELEPLIRGLLVDPHHQRFHDELLIKARVFEILYRILPFCEAADPSTAYEDIIYEKLKRSLTYLEENYADNITVEKIASVSNYSGSHFSKLFRQLTGDSFTRYLKNYRLEKAADRIRGEKTKISEIAIACGFTNLSYFSRSFYEKYRTTPSEYRKSEKKVTDPAS